MGGERGLGPLTVRLFVLLTVLPVVAAVQSHVTVEGWNVLELPGTDAALHHVLNGVGLRLVDLAQGGVLDERVGGLDGDSASSSASSSSTSTSFALLALSNELF